MNQRRLKRRLRRGVVAVVGAGSDEIAISAAIMSIFRRAAYSLGMMVRETGQALDRAGSSMQGIYAYSEQLSRHRQVMNLMNSKPIIGENVFIAPSASVIGNVELGASSSVWYGSVIRADANAISIGPRSNVQDRAVLYVSKNPATEPTVIGASVTIGHSAIVHGATISDEAMVGMGAVVENGALVKKHALVAAGSVVPSNAVVGEGELWAGAPAQMVRKLAPEEIEAMIASAEDYVNLAAAHGAENGKTHEQIEAEKLRRQLLDERSDDYNSHIGKLGHEHELVETQAQLIEKNRQSM